MAEQNGVLLTGAAGFIGYHLSRALLEQGIPVFGVDNLNDYYDVNLKKARLKLLSSYGHFSFVRADIADPGVLKDCLVSAKPDIVVHLAAQAGVRYSITHPDSYLQSNLIGFYRLLEACRHAQETQGRPITHLVYASSSSVYGFNRKVPYSTADQTDHPVSLYAATKKSNELMAYAYSKLYKIPATGLRFFTVYGPMGRPDMAYFSFTDKMVHQKPIQIFNGGDMYRDFTYIDDVVSGILQVMRHAPAPDENGARHRLYNIGHNCPENLMYFVETLEECLMQAGLIDGPAQKEFLPMQPGDVYQTYADIDDLIRDFGFRPRTKLRDGLQKFVEWYAGYYGKK